MIVIALCGIMRFYVFKQKTAYKMRISDWSSDVCSSDLRLCYHRELGRAHARREPAGRARLRTDRQGCVGERRRQARPGVLARHRHHLLSRNRVVLYRCLRRIHLALFLLSAAPLLVASLTGALLVYGPELQEALEPEIWAVEPRGAPLPVRTLLERVGAQRPDLRVWSVAFDPRPDRAWRLWLAGEIGREACRGRVGQYV